MNDRWERLIDLYHSAVSLPADERAALLAEECGGDLVLLADVERMITAHHRVSRPTGATSVIDAAPLSNAVPPAETAARVEPPASPPIAEDDAPAGIVVDSPEGEPIGAYAERNHLSVTERLQLLVQVCDAVTKTYRRGVSHGDLTPETILVTTAGAPRLPDPGLGDDATTTAADVYSLGLVLDHLLGGRVSSGARVPLRRELDGIVLKALRQEGTWRYETVDALADDVQRYLDNPPPRERRGGGHARPAKPARRLVSPVTAWALAGVAVVAALGFIIIPLLERPAAEVTPAAPQADAPPPRTRVHVGDLADRAQDPQLAAALSDALRAVLTESPSLAFVSTRSQGADEVTGSIELTAGGSYTIAAQLSTPRNPEGPASLQETAVDSTDVIHALSRLSERLREQLGESPASIQSAPRLEEVATASLPALRSFANASRAIRAGDRTSAVRLLKTAIALDTGFASAHRLLGLTYRDAADRARSQDALDHAVANQTRLPFYERNVTIATHGMATGSYAVAIDAYNRILARDPRNTRVMNSLGIVHAARREYAVQESLLVRAIAVDSGVPSLYTGLAMAAVNQAKYGAVRRVLNRTEQRFPGLRSTRLARIAFEASQQDWAGAEREARETLALASSDSVDALDEITTLGGILMTQGRLADAEQALRRAITLGTRRGAVRQSYAAALSLAYLELRYRRSPTAAVATMNATLARFPLAKMEPEDRPYDDVARLFADAGQPTRASDLMAQAVRASGQPGGDANRRWTAGAIAMAERRAWEGEIEIKGAAETHPCPICVLPDLARAYEVAGKPDSASAIYERYLGAPWQRRFDTDAFELGFAMKRLGELYQQQNDRAKAAAQYTALLQLWRGADAELGPLLADVRRRLDETGEASAAR